MNWTEFEAKYSVRGALKKGFREALDAVVDGDLDKKAFDSAYAKYCREANLRNSPLDWTIEAGGIEGRLRGMQEFYQESLADPKGVSKTANRQDCHDLGRYGRKGV